MHVFTIFGWYTYVLCVKYALWVGLTPRRSANANGLSTRINRKLNQKSGDQNPPKKQSETEKPYE
jgi:hypothetical protein